MNSHLPEPPGGDGQAGFLRGVLIGLAAGVAISALIVALSNAFDDEPSLAEQAREVIEANYFREVDPDALEGSSVRGMVAELRRRYDDRFSHYFGPKALQELDAATSGEFSGVGLTVNEVKGGLRVADVLPNTPAEDAGIDAGDQIVAVDGESIAGKPADISTAMIQGPKGTEVKLRVVPADGGPVREVSVERATIRVPAVDGRIVRVGPPGRERKVAYVHFATFSEGAHGELRDEIERLYRQGAQALVLDLRGNGGGLLNEAVLSASVFVDDGVIVSTSSRSSGDEDYDAVGDALDPKPMVVLINRDTASAAEILSAALQDYGLATLVGTRTYGKNTVQEVLHLPAGGALDLTIGEYVTSEGESLAEHGVRPDVKANDDPDTAPDEGLQGGLDEARSLLQGG
jgi:carboxyl-terminal processing protease